MMSYNSLQYIAIGDSLTAGIGIPFLNSGFPEFYRKLSEHTLEKRIYLHKFGKSGATTGDILNMLDSPTVRRAIKCANIITITAGGNDLINVAKNLLRHNDKKSVIHAMQQSQENYSKIIKKIQIIDKENPSILRLMNLYNPFPHIPVADEAIKTFNIAISRFAKQQNIKVADVYHVFSDKEKALLSKDGVHPNQEGYHQMALTFSKLGYAPLEY